MATYFSQPAAPADNYVLLTAGVLRLLLPQQDVGEAEYLDGELSPAAEPSRLQFIAADNTRKFVALSENMELLPQCPPNRFMVTRIGADELGWCWDDIQIFRAPRIDLVPLPPVLLSQDTPFTNYLELDGKLAFLCNAQHLRAAVLGQD